MTNTLPQNDENKQAWDANAKVWNERMADTGNDFVNLLQWPVIQPMLNIQPGQHVLDIACGNGLLSRRIAAQGAFVTAFDFSPELIKLAQEWDSEHISYHVVDATDASALKMLGDHVFDSALCNMALFDIADIQPLFTALPELLKPEGTFVFSLAHPAFNNASSVHIAEEWDDGGIKTQYSVKISRYMTPFSAFGVALKNQPKPQLYFDRPLEYYLKAGFANGFVLDGFEERAFPAGYPQKDPLSWGGNFSEIPPVLVARMRLIKP